MQLRFAVQAQTEFPEVWVTLGAQDRAVVIGRLAETMTRAAVAFGARPGGERNEGISDDGQQGNREEGRGEEGDGEHGDGTVARTG